MKTIVCVSLDTKELEQFRLQHPHINFSSWVRQRIREHIKNSSQIEKSYEEAWKAQLPEEKICVRKIPVVTPQECSLCNEEGCKIRMHKFKY